MKKVTDKVKRSVYYATTLTGVVALALVVTLFSKSADRKREQIQQYMNEQVTGDGGEESLYTMEDVPTHEITMEEQPGTGEIPAFAEDDADAGEQDEQPAGYDGETKLDWPVTGNVLLPYSMDTTVYFKTLDQYKCNPAVLIEAKQGDSVSSVAAGTVTGKESGGETGTTVSVDLGNGYTAIYGQLDKVTVGVGDRVQERTILGKVAKPSRFYSKEGSHLYFEMQKDGKPVNPMNLLK